MVGPKRGGGKAVTSKVLCDGRYRKPAKTVVGSAQAQRREAKK
jgi:hypothetical protein